MFDTTRLQRIQSWMQDHVDASRLPGASVLIEAAGQEVYSAHVGLRDVAAGKPFERDALVRLYSMTKPVTSAVLMMFLENGRVHLDAPVSEFLPEFSDMTALHPGAKSIGEVEACATPTLHHLLTHTSGMSYAFNPGLLPAAMEASKVFFAADQAILADQVTALSSLPLAFHPGRRWEYSVGIDVIGRVIEVLSGKPLDRVFRELLLDPLGMAETGFRVPDAAKDRFANLYTPLAGNPMALNDRPSGDTTLRCSEEAAESIFHRTTLFSGGGGLVGTLDDYMKFCRFLHSGLCRDGPLLSPATLRFMQRNHLPGEIAAMGPSSFAEQPMDGMGFGLGGAVVLDPARARTPGHVGDFSWGGMASTFFWIDPSKDLSVVFLTQLAPSSSYPLRAQLKALVHGAMMS